MVVVFGLFLTFFNLYQLFFFFASFVYSIRNKTRSNLKNDKINFFAIIIPAHNEELLIGNLIESIKRSNYPKDYYETIVIADNCTDRTSEIANGKGIKCYERVDTSKRGKPYALNWLISKIDLGRYDAFVIIDADTIIESNFLKIMNEKLNNGEKVIQGYFGVLNPDENWLTRLSILPGILKFRLHFPGKKLLNLSCPLAGNGMCFSSEVFKKFGWNAFSLTENWEYYIILTLNGYVVTSAEDAIIYSQVAKSLKLGKNQRIRWLKGQIDTILRYWKPLLKNGVFSFDKLKIDAFIELIHPSYSMLFFWSIVYLFITFIIWKATGTYYFTIWWAFIIFVSQILYFLFGLIIQKAPLKTWLSLVMVPPYLIWKVVINLNSLVNFRNKKWLKTERHRSK